MGLAGSKERRRDSPACGRPLASAAIWILLAFPAAAEQYARLSGLILDISDAGVPGSMITVVNEDTGFRRVVWSRPDGGYNVTSLEPGVYKITVRKPGFRTMIRFGLKLDAGRPARLDFTLAIGSMQESITVEGTPAALNSQDGAVGTLVDREEIENLPVNGRGLLSLLELAPGTVVTPATRGESGQFTVNGQRPNTHYFTVDGVSANTGVSAGGLPAQSTGGSLPGMTAFGSLHDLISLDALEEMRVQTSSTIPEFGRLPGAQVSLSSRSGSNEFHGSLLYFFRHERLDANDWFGNSQGQPRAPARLNDFGASAGGPLWRNHTFFFLAYEGLRLRQPGYWRMPVPALDARHALPDWAQTAVNLFPAPNGPPLGSGLALWTGHNNRPSRLDAGSVRLDHALTSRLTAFARFSDSPSSSEFGSTQISRLHLASRSLTLGLNARPRADIVLDTHANASDAGASSFWRQSSGQGLPPCYFQPLTDELLRAPGLCTDLVRVSIAGLNDIISGREGNRAQSQFQFSQTASFNRASHTFRVGFDDLRLAPKRHDLNGALNVFADSLAALNDSRNLWVAGSKPQYLSDVLKEFSVFAQDTWRVSPALTLTYGVRWELSTSAVPKQPVWFLDPAANIVNQYQRSIWPEADDNVAPRLGIAYRLGRDGRTVIRAGGGLYYDSSVSIATDLINDGPLGIQQAHSGINGIFSTFLSFGFLPNLRLPRVANWSASLERALTPSDVVSITYVGSVGRDLLRRELGGPGTTDTTWVVLATNHGDSHYHGLQAEYRRRLARGFDARAVYCWSHSIDDSSTDSLIHWTGEGQTARHDRGSSDFDVRHAFTAAFTWQAPARPRLWRGWAMDGIFRTRTSFPLTVLESDHYQSLTFANAFRPDLVFGQPLWINDRSAPGGRRINPAAFTPLKSGVQGNLGRNVLSGFGMSQLDLALRRQFRLGERAALQFRIDAFNVMNQANFADPQPYLVNPLFGQSLSMLNLMLGSGSPASGLAPMFQTGGARSLQLGLRVQF